MIEKMIEQVNISQTCMNKNLINKLYISSIIIINFYLEFI